MTETATQQTGHSDILTPPLEVLGDKDGNENRGNTDYGEGKCRIAITHATDSLSASTSIEMRFTSFQEDLGGKEYRTEVSYVYALQRDKPTITKRITLFQGELKSDINMWQKEASLDQIRFFGRVVDTVASKLASENR